MDLVSAILETCINMYNNQKSKKITWSEPLTTELSTWTSNEYDRSSPVNIIQIVDTENIENINSLNSLYTLRKRPSYHSGLCNI